MMPAVGWLTRSRTFLGGVGSEHVWNFSSTVACRILLLLLYAFVVSYFLNVGSKGDFAAISLILLVFSYVQLLDLGIGYAVTQRYGRALATVAPGTSDILNGALPVYLLCAGVASTVLFMAAAPLSNLLFGSYEHSGTIRLLGFGVWPLFLSAFSASIMQAMNKLVWINLSRLIIDSIKAAAFFLAASVPEVVRTAVAITVLGAFVRLAFDVAVTRRLVGTFAIWIPRFSWKDFHRNFSLGWPMVIALVFGIANTLMDRIYVSRVLGEEELANYTIAYDVASKAFFLVGAVAAALYTPILRRSATARSHRSLLIVSYLSVVAIALGYFGPLGLFAPSILEWWINGEVAAAAGSVVRVGALMGVTYLTMSVAFSALQAAGHAIIVMLGTVIAFAVMITGFVLMPVAWGAEGVMAVVTGAFFVQFVFYTLAMRVLVA